MKLLIIIFILTLSVPEAYAKNNEIESFNAAKKILEKQIYNNYRNTFYCGAKFDSEKRIIVPNGFTTSKYLKRAQKLEWEHVVPAENFGKTFIVWRDGHKKCVNSKGKPFRGWRCAEKISGEYRLMQADMFNLYPAIGAVNALRSNYNFAMLPAEQSYFGSCSMKVYNKKVEPPELVRGVIARTYLYMETTYKRYKMSTSQRQLMNAWDRMYPVDNWECIRAKKISHFQKSVNNIVKSRCKVKGLL